MFNVFTTKTVIAIIPLNLRRFYMNSLIKKDTGVVSSFAVYRHLGYTEHRTLKRVIAANIDEFKKFGEVRVSRVSPAKTGGRPTEGYLLNLNQLMLLLSMSKNSSGSSKNLIVAAMITAYSNSTLLAVLDLLSSIDVDEVEPDRYVYVARESVSGRYKIGISKSPSDRVKALNVGNPEKLELVHAYLATDSKYQSELLAHAIYEKERLCGEWFGESIDLTLLPSYNAVCVAAENYGECDCKECEDASNISHFLIGLEPMSRDDFISEAMKKTKLSFDICARNVTELEDMGCIDYV